MQITRFLSTLIAGLMASTSAMALTLSVGATGCDYANLQSAIDALAASSELSHKIKLKSGTINIANGVIMNLPANLITLRGGYEYCVDSVPTIGQFTTLDASGGIDGSAISINAGTRAQEQQVNLNRLIISGGSHRTAAPTDLQGGGLDIRGHVQVVLNEGSQVSDNSSQYGGGIYVQGADSLNAARFDISGGSMISDNIALDNGGGIFADSDATIGPVNGQISTNTARYGGGVYIAPGARLQSFLETGDVFAISFNRAELSDGSGGAGGGIFLDATGGQPNPINLQGRGDNPIRFVSNSAINGAGLYAYNGGAFPVALNLINTSWFGQRASANGAAMTLVGGIDTLIDSLPGCSYAFLGQIACSLFYDNIAANGPGVIDTYARSSLNLPGNLFVRRTHFQSNEGAPALISVATVSSNRVNVEAVVVRDNRAVVSADNSASRTLFRLAGQTQQAIRYSTVLENDADSIFTTTIPASAMSGSMLDLRGSIIWAPGTQIWRDLSGGLTALSFSNCLIAHSAVGLPAGAIVADPMLDPDLTPGPISPALDVCDNVYIPEADFYGRTRGFDQVGITNLHGPNDLGAVERIVEGNDLIFANGFE